MIRIGIAGYGNLGQGVECAVAQNPDMELAGVFTRRSPETVHVRTAGVRVCHMDEACQRKDDIDVMIICGGSAADLPEMTPEIASCFHVVDSFDTHADISRHYDAVNRAAEHARTVAMISAGWDPGMFSLNRLYSSCILPQGNTYTFWGRGVSQGHSDAVRRIPGVVDARQYTVPIEETLNKVRCGENREFTAREMHQRECFVVTEENADQKLIESQIKAMPNYFADYDTTVHFISKEEMEEDHRSLPHGGFVIRNGSTGWGNECSQTIEYQLTLDSNPYFTGSVLAACARAVYRMAERGEKGCKTIFDVAPADLSVLSGEQLRAQIL